MKKFLGLLISVSAAVFAQSSQTIPFRAILSPANETPAITDLAASGTGIVLLHVVRDSSGKIISASVDFNASYSFAIDATITGMHIHKGDATIAGPVTINSGINTANTVAVTGGAGSITRQGQVSATDAAGLDTVNGMIANPSGFYLNIHTTTYPGGAIRGQLQRAEMVVLMGLMNAANEVPPNDGITGTGVTGITAIRSFDANGNFTGGRVSFDADHIGLPDGVPFTGYHIHSGPAGVNAPVTINTGINTANSVPVSAAGGHVHYDVEIPASGAAADSLNGLFVNPSNFYVNFHTSQYPGGIIRGQLRSTDVLRFPVTMLPSSEVPAVTGLDASGQASVTAYTVRDTNGKVQAGTVIFDVNARFAGATTVTGLHIHDGSVTVSGPVTINTGVNNANAPVLDSGAGNIYKVVTVSGGQALDSLNDLVSNPEMHYVNLHTPANPGGAFRSQLVVANTRKPVVNAVISAISDPTRLTVAPQGLMTIFGTDLLKLPGNPAAVSDGFRMPLSYNGTQITLGGKTAALVQSGDGFIVAQVPSDVSAGSLPLIVTNPNGPAASVSVAVAPTAPAIFFDSNGGVILKNSDFTLVGTANPAKAGDIVLLYTTGLGITNPALGTGQIAPAIAPFALAKGVTGVQMGGKDAQIIYSLASPGYAGLYQIAVVVPTGLTPGNVPVTVKTADGLSNSVTMAVQ